MDHINSEVQNKKTLIFNYDVELLIDQSLKIVKYSELTLLQRVGVGASGEVYHARYDKSSEVILSSVKLEEYRCRSEAFISQLTNGLALFQIIFSLVNEVWFGLIYLQTPLWPGLAVAEY